MSSGGLPDLKKTRATKQRGIYSETLGRSDNGEEQQPEKWAHKDLARQPNQKAPGIRSFNPSQTAPVKPSSAGAKMRAAPPKALSPINGGRTGRVKPKVIIPYDQAPGKLPRRLQIERKTRQYADLDVNSILNETGIQYDKFTAAMDHTSGANSFLALETFDDVSFEVHEPTEWIAEGTDEGTCSIPARALCLDKQGLGSFQSCTVTGYDDQEAKFLVTWADDSTAKVSRLHLNFLAEDPNTFVKRVVSAHTMRRQVEADIRYSLYVDSMPTDEMRPLDSAQTSRVLGLALYPQALSGLDVDTLLGEVNIDHARTMNKIIFDSSLDDPAQGLRKTLNLPASDEAKPEPKYSGVWKLPPHDYSRHTSDFCFHSFYTKGESISAARNCNTANLELKDKECAFNFPSGKTVRLEEFHQMQNSHINYLTLAVKDKWTSSLVKCIVDSLANADKSSWLNLAQTNREVYMLSKLKKFMRTVNFMMEDTVRFLMEDSLDKYHNFFFNASRYQVDVKKTYHVEVKIVGKDESIAVQKAVEGEEPQEEEPEPEHVTQSIDLPNPDQPPLFTVDLVLREGEIQYTTGVSQFHVLPLAIFDKALESMQNITQIETRVMDKILWHGTQNKLAAVRREEGPVTKIYTSIKARLKQALLPMQNYIDLFDVYKSVIVVNPEQYVQEFAETEPDPSDFAEELKINMKERERIAERIPKRVWLGMVLINSEDIRNKLMEHYTKIIDKLIDLFSRETKISCDKIKREFVAIDTELHKEPTSIEELTKAKEYRANLPTVMKDFETPILESMDRFAMLDTFSIKPTKDMFNLQWQTFGWPRHVYDLIQKKETEFESEADGFMKTMKKEQQDFNAELIEVETKVNTFNQHKDMDKVKKIAEKAQEVQDKLDQLSEQSREFNNNEILLNMQATDYSHQRDVGKNFEPYYNLWTSAAQWTEDSEMWMRASFMELDGQDINNKCTEWNKNMAKVVRNKIIMENPGCQAIASQIKTDLDNFKPILPLIIALRNPGMRDRHWEKLSRELLSQKITFVPDESLTLDKIINEYKLQDHLELISKVGENAGKEYQIEQALDKMASAWKPINFELMPYKATDTYVIKGVDEIMQLLDEHVVMTGAMQFSAFKGPFEERINTWSTKLGIVYEVVEEWLQVQRQWMSLQSIFSSPDINKQLPAEGKRFAAVNKTWVLTMSQVFANPAVIEFCGNQALLDKLQDANSSLQTVQKRLSEYLDKKRAAFSRFYFLANEELLQILSQTEDPTAVQPHLKKCFENVHKLRFTDTKLMTSMFSGDGEEVPFTKALDPKGKSVEFWLGDVEDEMRCTIADFFQKACNDYYNKKRTEWVMSWPGQTILGGSQIYYTAEIETALRESGLVGLKAYYQKWLAQLGDMVVMVRGTMSKVQRRVCEALIVLDVHARDVIEGMCELGVSDPNDFQWIRQMRYYLGDAKFGKHKSEVYVQMVQAKFPYCNEYLGNTLRLVVTPLTDRCYTTLMSAVSLHLGGAPAGPAGTGKTETVKDLSKCVAKQCVVFNCSDGLNFLAMSKFFKGLASSGAWACFDEFNRIDIEVLSVVAQQIMCIWDAIRGDVDTFMFDGTELKLNSTCSVFITMNPGYAGRTELPDNLEVLFRPVAMMVPDYALIGEISMLSFGFNNAKPLARKMVATFRLCSEQLSSQDHYDYGMRAVKTVITRAGILKRMEPEADESILLLRALCDVNIPKFLGPDLPLFAGIISDLFPGLKKPESDYGDLLDSIILSCFESGLQPSEYALTKTIELYETTVVRHGLMLVGPTGGGKTSTIRTLKTALSRLKDMEAFDKVLTYSLNPKAITMGQLYGDSDEHTGEWSDGVLCGIMRTCIEDETPSKKWVIFDGPVDAIWIENMNTVLDDNKKLCLVSGEILQLTNYMTMMFEVEDLAVASPATVSRCGMVYLEPEYLGFRVICQSWIEGLDPIFNGVRAKLANHFDTYFEPLLFFLRKSCVEQVPSVNNNLVQSCLNLLTAFLKPYVPIEGARDAKEKLEEYKTFAKYIDAYFHLALVWSLGATMSTADRPKFSVYLRQLWADYSAPSIPPADGYVFDYVFDLPTQNWIGWVESAPYTFDSRLSYAETIVPTLDSIRNTYLLKSLVNVSKQVLFTGNTGTGKTINVNKYLSTLPDVLMPVSVTFSAATSANQVEDMLFAKMTKRRARVYGPPLGKRFVIFVDDMNMPTRETYFAQPPIEILRQWMDHDGWYNRRTLQFNNIFDVSFVGAMGPPGGGRNPVTPRFIRHFNIISHADMDAQSLFLIFHTIVVNTLLRFEPAIQGLAKACVNSTVNVFNTVTSQLLPTPSKVHYTFNLRDLSKVFQGILSANPPGLTEKAHFAQLWVHENQRVFKDRLINDEDRQWMDDLLAKNMMESYGLKWDGTISKECLLFGDYMQGMNSDKKPYEIIPDISSVQKIMEAALVEYNEQFNHMGLVLFKDAIEHVSRISRILRQPSGNALLLGVGGSGRQSLTRLAAFMGDFKLFMVTVTKSYNLTDWHDDVKILLMDAGMKEEPTVFLFNDTQITNEAFLEDVNNILNTGEVPNLFTSDDMDEIFMACKLDCQRKNIPVTKLNAYGQFIGRVKNNLHIVICMSPRGEVFRNRLRMFPALVNCCTIDWFSDWPVSALINVGNYLLSEGEDLKLEKTDKVVEMFGYIHQSVTDKSLQFQAELSRFNYVTPTSYLELLNVFKTLLHDKRNEVGGLRGKLQDGLDKLESAEGQVSQLKVDLIEKQPQLKEAQESVAALMIQIEKDSADGAKTKVIVEGQEAEASVKAAEVLEIKNSAQAELDKALPMLDAAVASLNSLKVADLNEVKNFKTPPGGVKLTMEACCVMLKDPLNLKFIMKAQEGTTKKITDYWETAQKSFLKDPKKLLNDFLEYDKDNIKENTIRDIKPYISMPEFTPKLIEKASIACKAICQWVHAMYSYSEVSKIVEPKRIQLRESEAELGLVTEKLNKAQAELKEVEDRLDDLAQKKDAGIARSEALTAEVTLCTLKLERAEKLIGGLGGEKTRWRDTVADLTVQYGLITGDVLVSAGTLAYLGAFTSEYRTQTNDDWRAKLTELGISFTPGCSVIKTLADPVKVRSWQLCGLPTDNVSTENGIVISKARRWPLMIDPQGQASRFIRRLGQEQFPEGITVVKLTDKSFLQTLETSIQFGKWVLIEAVLEELDPALEPLLLQQLVNLNGVPHVKLGENMIAYSDQFRLYIATNLPNPHYSPELQVKVTLLNFTITPSGLEDQMLGTVVAQELPEMEARKSALTVQNAKMKAQLQGIEDQILKLLSESTGDILEDETLIDVLATSKTTSKEINQKVAESETVEKEIDETRKSYIPVAFRASLLYFCISGLSKIDPMYQYSLDWFVALFIADVAKAEPSEEITQRIANINAYFTKSLYENVCRSLFEHHKLLFSFLLSINIQQGSNLIDPAEWFFLISGGTSKKTMANPASAFLTENVWQDILAISDLPVYDGFETAFKDKLPLWRQYYDDDDADKATLPAPWDTKLNSFQKLLVLKILRSDKMAPALQKYVADSLGPEYNEFPQFDINLSFAAANNVSPLIFVLSRGADPTGALTDFAEEQGQKSNFKSISLGQGQGPLAQKYIEEASKRGGWVLLQNCHLAVSWLPTLERIVQGFKPEENNEDFRLWLTSSPTPKFPVSILQNGVKMTKEPAKGLRANLTQSYWNFTDSFLDSTKAPGTFKKLLYGMCFFHASILERRKFGPLGWNIPYAFAENDLEVCLTQLADFIDMYEEVPYKVIHYLTYDINYGGRVTDDKDRRTLMTILDDFINPEVLRDDYVFSAEAPAYKSPPIGNKEYYMATIGAMEANAGPEVFGMHENAQITSAQDETRQLFYTVLALLPKSSAGAGEKSREEVLADVATQMLEQCPQEWDVDSVGKKFPTLYTESMNTVVVQEIIRYNKLLAKIQRTLVDLKKAIKGEVVMSTELEEMADRLFNNLVPGTWAAVAYPSLMPLSAWMKDLIARCAFIQRWVDEGTPIVFWISGFFFPQAFLTGSLQNYARKYTLPVDGISFTYEIAPEVKLETHKDRPSDGIYICGLYLQGCCYDAAQVTLVESRPRELFSQFPTIWCKPEEDRKACGDDRYICPVYKVLTRAGTLSTTGHSTNFVCYVELPTKFAPRRWIKAGVALFAALNY